jgi:hypothetical protein
MESGEEWQTTGMHKNLHTTHAISKRGVLSGGGRRSGAATEAPTAEQAWKLPET